MGDIYQRLRKNFRDAQHKRDEKLALQLYKHGATKVDLGPSATDSGSGPEFQRPPEDLSEPGWSGQAQAAPIGTLTLHPVVLAQLNRIEKDLIEIRNWIATIEHRSRG
ncbi:MAG: hypothetical protein V3S55_07660 [Nitrospiraceae bacterium]